MTPLAATILARDYSQRTSVFIPEWGTEVYLHCMTGFEREAFERLYDDARTAKVLRASVAVMCCRDKDGNRIFEDDQVEALNARGVPPLSRIYDTVMRISAVSKEDIDTYEKNSEAMSSAGSSTSSA